MQFKLSRVEYHIYALKRELNRTGGLSSSSSQQQHTVQLVEISVLLLLARVRSHPASNASKQASSSSSSLVRSLQSNKKLYQLGSCHQLIQSRLNPRSPPFSSPYLKKGFIENRYKLVATTATRGFS